jgi:hypothetical protein
MGHFLGFFALRYAQDNLGVKKVAAPSKNPAKCPIICFAQEKKIISQTFKISSTLIVIMSCWPNTALTRIMQIFLMYLFSRAI